MAIIKCKMCGGDLILEEGSNVAECEYCGSRQTVPSADNEKKLNLFARANRLRANNEFDKAAGVYEAIVADFPEEAEAYWGLILCKYGIEYVDDPATGKKIPTCHRSSFDSVMDDPNFELVMENADPIARRVYREEAKQLEELRKGIIEVSSKEEPYDIFICYKETAEDGQRTLDSVLAQDVYDMLTENGYRVFFSRVTLEDKLGQEYEPYIFAALNSAKIMLAFGTDYDYYNAVWVKNEWSRFLQLIAKGEKKTLIPCYKNIDAYDMPREFAKLQAQDLGKVGAMQDLLRGIRKILPKEQRTAHSPSRENAAPVVDPNLSPLLSRGNALLAEENWEAAKDYFERVLDADAMNAEAYLGLALAESRKKSLEAYIDAIRALKDEQRVDRLQAGSEMKAQFDRLAAGLAVEGYISVDEIKGLFHLDGFYYDSREASARENRRKAAEQLKMNRNFFRAKKYAQGELKELLYKAEKSIEDLLTQDLEQAKQEAKKAKSEVEKRLQEYYAKAELDAKELHAKACSERQNDYERACTYMKNGGWQEAIDLFRRLGTYKDSADNLQKCIDAEEAAEVRATAVQQIRDLEIAIQGVNSEIISAKAVSDECDKNAKLKIGMIVCFAVCILAAILLQDKGSTVTGLALIAGIVVYFIWNGSKKSLAALTETDPKELNAQKIASLNEEAKSILEWKPDELARLEKQKSELRSKAERRTGLQI